MNKIEKTAVPMRQQPAAKRIKNFKEVPLGYTEKEAIREASRCIQCKDRPCVLGCPVLIDIPEFIKAIKEKRFQEAIDIIRRANCLPAITGRVCPQEDQCQKVCLMGKTGEPISIGGLERFAADWEQKYGKRPHGEAVKSGEAKNKSVVVIGSGPAGLSAAFELAKLGYKVTIFEGFHKFGGVLVYGIPEFRLPKAIVSAEVELLRKMGVSFSANTLIGRALTIEDLFKEGFSTVFIGSGAGLPKFMGIPGENLNGIYSANEFLTRVNLMKAYKFPEYDTPVKRGERVAVIGGGNVALDAARTALRLKGKKVYLIYRRSGKEMPARKDEIRRAREEGLEFKFLTNLVRYIPNKEGFVRQVECIKMKLREKDSSGRRAPVVVPGSKFRIDVNEVIVAIGTTPNPIIARTTRGLRLKGHGQIEADEFGRASIPRVFAAGDIVSGEATVISAMGQAKRCAEAIDEYIRGEE